VPAEMIDLWPMADGKEPGESSFAYNELAFFQNRDPRFYRTFAFPGAIWPFQGNLDFTTWHYVWYDNQETLDDPRNTGWCGNYAGTPASAAIVRKRTSPTASYNNTDFFDYSNLPFIEIRMGEILLNLAEAAAGSNQLNEAYTYLRAIRERAYGADSPYASSDYGLSATLKSERGKLLGAILYERQIELVYEGKRFEDMRWWLLLDGGEGVEPAYANGNTHSWLGYSDAAKVSPVGLRHHGIQIVYPQVNPGANAAIESNDPFAGARPKGLDPDSPYFQQDMEELAGFYRNFIRKTTDNLDNSDNRIVFWTPRYYFLGLSRSNLTTMPYLWQTKGWLDYYDNPGLFDIFSDELPSRPQVS
ncbi:MAG: RagB/SusD family nutrient uptake outer membrane protein, partial [Rikenellaceae bacterium]|nr:RagB/SusD family nutrient uptake outer membrane protein [Rikenellaceae bacterium]